MENKEIKILLAAPRGFCAGVVRAIDIVEKVLNKYGSPVYVRHEIVHNKHVVDDLKKKGAIFVDELSQIKDLSRPVIFLDRGFGLTPMNQGLRAVGTVELGGLKNELSKKRINYLNQCAKELLPQLEKHDDEWLGFRPTLPDFLPIMGPSLKNKNIIYAFGHHHLGWTLGAVTGQIISGIVAEENTNLDLSPYSSKRFS